jgi:hypothetical protein
MFFEDGRVFLGDWWKQQLQEGEMSLLGPDGTRTLFQCKFSARKDFMNRVGFANQEEIEKKKTSGRG